MWWPAVRVEDDDVVAPVEPLGGDDRLWVGPQLVRAAEATSTTHHDQRFMNPSGLAR